jgi:hypothetical protein
LSVATFEWWQLVTVTAVAVSVAIGVNLLRDATESYFRWNESDNPTTSLRLFLLSLRGVFSPAAAESTLRRVLRALVGPRDPVTFPSPNDRGKATIFSAALVSALYALTGMSAEFLLYTLFVGSLLIQGLVCRDTRLLPFAFSVPLAVAGAMASAAQLIHVSLLDSLIGFAAGFGVPWLLRFLFYFLTDKEALGYGVAVLGGAIGVWLGWLGAIVALVGGMVFTAVQHGRFRAKYRSLTGEEPEIKEVSVGNEIGIVAIAWLLIVLLIRLGS